MSSPSLSTEKFLRINRCKRSNQSRLLQSRKGSRFTLEADHDHNDENNHRKTADDNNEQVEEYTTSKTTSSMTFAREAHPEQRYANGGNGNGNGKWS